jgi:GTPase SAR1 family protein
MSKHLTIDDSEVIVQIWDTAGQERFHQNTLGSAFYRGSDGAVLVYDVNNPESMDQIGNYL